MGKSQERTWRSLCANVIEHLLKIEHYSDKMNPSHWRKEICTWRDQMHSTLADDPGMKGVLHRMLHRAWAGGRSSPVTVLTGYEVGDFLSRHKKWSQYWESRLPADRSYSLTEIMGCDYREDMRPLLDVCPPAIARILNAKFGAEYSVTVHGRGSNVRMPVES